MSVVVILTDEKDQERAERTIHGVRTTGKWIKDIVWVAIAFDPDEAFVQRWNVQILKRSPIDVRWLWDLRQNNPMSKTDHREIKKLVQFSKWRVFDPFFHKWRSMLYIDAGTHIANPIELIFRVPHKGFFVAPDDRYPFNDPGKTFRIQWDATSMPDRYRDLVEYCRKIDPEWPDQGGYFLNCMWLMDTSLIRETTVDDLVALLRRFPISRTNEMAIMNLYFHDNWRALPERHDGQLLFDWTERFGRKTPEYILLKYPHFPE